MSIPHHLRIEARCRYLLIIILGFAISACTYHLQRVSLGNLKPLIPNAPIAEAYETRFYDVETSYLFRPPASSANGNFDFDLEMTLHAPYRKILWDIAF